MKLSAYIFYFVCLIFFTFCFSTAYSQILNPVGDIAIGSTGGDYLIRTIPTRDGGYFLIGFANTVNTDISGPAQGNYDYWAVKTNANGQILWNRLLGSASNDYVYDVAEDLVNGGFVIIGYTESIAASGNISTPSKGGPTDIWVVKVANDGRSIIWEKRLGGNREDYAMSITQTANGNYLIAGSTNSAPNTGDLGSDPARGDYDYRLININPSGAVVWDRRLGGSNFDGTGLRGGLMSVLQTTDGGYLIGGRSFSNPDGDKISSNYGAGSDIWLVKLDASRTIQWDITLGGTDEDKLTSVIETSDGYVVGGTATLDDPVLGYAKNKDYLVVKLDKSGAVVWQNSYGGLADDELTSVIQTADGGFWLGGWSLSGEEADKSQPGFGSADFWIIKLLSDGSKDYDVTFGGSAGDYLTNVIETSDDGLLLAGYSSSNVSGSKTVSSKGRDDFWLLKLNGIVPLPVDLLFFNAEVVSAHAVQLSWSTASEVNSATFTIERSVDAISFSSILNTEGAGNSNQVRTYSLTDNNPSSGTSYYRLKQTDFNGNFKYSKIISIQLDEGDAYDFSVFPNPTNGSLLSVKLNKRLSIQNSQISLEDMLGNKILEKPLNNDGNAIINILDSPSFLKRGMYIVTVTTQAGAIRKKLIVQ